MQMTQTKIRPRAAPVVQLLMGLKQQTPTAKQDHNDPPTIEEFDRERMGIAAKE
jgi:hypothetical protein